MASTSTPSSPSSVDRLLAKESQAHGSAKSYNAISEPDVLSISNPNQCSCDGARHSSESSLGWRFGPSLVMTFVSLSLAALFASLMLLNKPIPSEALVNDLGRLPAMGYNSAFADMSVL